LNKSIRNFALSAALLLSAAPMFANVLGTNPHPQGDLVRLSLSLGDYASIALNLFGL
jgi:hypothetical protein